MKLAFALVLASTIVSSQSYEADKVSVDLVFIWYDMLYVYACVVSLDMCCHTSTSSHMCMCLYIYKDELDGKDIDDAGGRLLRRKKGKNENPVTAYVKVVGSRIW